MADQFFGSLPLAQKLQDEGYKFILSCQCNRPSSLFTDYTFRCLKKQGELMYIESEDGDICALTFWDSKKCNFLANIGSTDIVESERERLRCEIVELYNKYMNGVDKADAALNKYMNRHRNVKWTSTLVFALLKMMAVNAYKVKQELTGNKRYQQRDFLSRLIVQLIGRSEDDESKDPHMIVKVDVDDKGACARCSKNGSKSSAHYYCPGCCQHLHAECFVAHHTGYIVRVIRKNERQKGGKRMFKIHKKRTRK